VRYQPSGMIDPTFGTNGVARTTSGTYIDGLALQPDGRVVVAGFSQNQVDHFSLARFNRDGTPDLSFGTAGQVATAFGPYSDQAYSVGLEQNGNIVAVGSSCQATCSTLDFALAEYRPNGSPYTPFGHLGQVLTSMGKNEAYASTVQSDGKIVAAGGPLQFAIARYLAS